MDVTVLVKDVIPFLAPFLPYLLKAGEKAAEEAGEKLGEASWERAKALWGRLRPKVEAKPAALEAAQDVAAQPDDEDAQAALRRQLKKLLAEDQALAAEVARLMADEVTQRVTAEGGSSVEDVEQRAGGGPTQQEVSAKGDSSIKGVRQTRE